MNFSSIKKKLTTSFIAICITFVMLVGSTYAWFTDSNQSGVNQIKSGNLDVVLTYSNSYNGSPVEVDENTNIFTDINGNDIIWEPGAFASGRFEVKNNGTLALKYQLDIIYGNATKAPNGNTLANILNVYVLAREKSTGTDNVMADSTLENLQIDSAVPNYDPIEMPYLKDGVNLEAYLLPEESITYEIGILWKQTDKDNEYNVKSGLSIDFIVSLVATQMNYENDGDGFHYDVNSQFSQKPKIPDRWDGTADTSWYNDTDTEFLLDSVEQLAGLAELVDNGNNFSGKTIKLDKDMNLYYIENGAEEPKSFDPIGDNSPFAGTFDGQGHTINNLYQSGWAFGYEWGSYGSIGLFGELESATIKNVNIKGAESYVEGGDVGGICGSATGTCVFENITIEDSVFATYNNGNGGIIGWSGAGNYTFKNITISKDVVLAGLWGSFDSSIGGIVGQAEPGATYNFENVDIACRLDVYNDCTASYDYYNYRMCGMIIGRCEETTTIDGANYPDMSKYNVTCNNVTVTYGEWANYHYCEPTPGLNGGRGMRVEAGYSYDGLPADYDHSQCVDNHMNLIPFYQIFGGDQIAVKGLKTYDGVTVNKNGVNVQE